MDIFGKKKAQALQDEIDQLKKRNAELESMMTPEMRDLDTAKTALKGHRIPYGRIERAA